MFKGLKASIIAWGEQRGFYHPKHRDIVFTAQVKKLREEWDECLAEIEIGDTDKLRDELGDCFVVLIAMGHLRPNLEWGEFRSIHDRIAPDSLDAILRRIKTCLTDNNFAVLPQNIATVAHLHGLSVESCLQTAYAKIKDRKGQMINGEFVREVELPHKITYNGLTWVLKSNSNFLWYERNGARVMGIEFDDGEMIKARKQMYNKLQQKGIV